MKRKAEESLQIYEENKETFKKKSGDIIKEYIQECDKCIDEALDRCEDHAVLNKYSLLFVAHPCNADLISEVRGKAFECVETHLMDAGYVTLDCGAYARIFWNMELAKDYVNRLKQLEEIEHTMSKLKTKRSGKEGLKSEEKLDPQ